MPDYFKIIDVFFINTYSVLFFDCTKQVVVELIAIIDLIVQSIDMQCFEFQ